MHVVVDERLTYIVNLVCCTTGARDIGTLSTIESTRKTVVKDLLM